MADSDLSFVPRDAWTLQRFSKGDKDKLRAYLLMLGAFLQGRNENTRRTYRCAIRQFFETFDWICPEDVTVAHAVAFKTRLLDAKRDPATVYYRISALTSFFDFMMRPTGATEKALLTSNPFHSVPRHDIKPTAYARAEAVEWSTLLKILNAIPPDPVGMRDKAILLFFAFTGRRRAEVASLRIENLDLKNRSYWVKVKGGEIQSYELPDICFDALQAYWIASDRLRDLHPEAGVFTATRTCPITKHLDPDRPLSPRHMNEILTRSALRADVPLGEVRIHGLRHMAARDLDRAGMRLQDIQRFLGHATPNTTQIYLGRLSGPSPSHEKALLGARAAAEKIAKEMLAYGPPRSQ